MSDALRIAHGQFGRVALLDMDAPLVRHAHPHCHVLIKAEGADTQFMVRSWFAPLTGENAVLINAWEPHHYAHDLKRPRTIILALYIEPQWLGQFRSNWTASGTPGFFERTCVGLTSRIRRLADEMAVSLAEGAETAAVQEARLSALMIAVIERFTKWQRIGTSLREIARLDVDRRIRRAVSEMRQDPAERGDMASLARRAGLSRAHFFRLFERSTHVSPRVFLNMLRLERGVSELLDGIAPIATISERLGFSAPPHFTRFFRDHAGAPPSGFRAAAERQINETPG